MKKMIRRYYFISYTWLMRRSFRSNGRKVHFIHKSKPTDTLLVVLSAFTPKGVKGRFNYISTLNKIPHSQLFILDRYGFDGRGAYYLGEQGDFDIEEAVKRLIQSKIEEYGYKKVVFIGSSKGGYGALLFACDFNNSTVIMGAPQYYLGHYLGQGENQDTLKYIMGDISSDARAYLDYYMADKLTHKFWGIKEVNVMYSDKEHTYEEHIQPMLDKLKDLGVPVNEAVESFTNHSDIGKHFPAYILRVLGKMNLQ